MFCPGTSVATQPRIGEVEYCSTMGTGFSSSRPSSADSGWGDTEEKDEDLYQPVKNYDGEIVGWKERSESDKLRRKRAREDFVVIEEDENESFVENSEDIVEDLEVIEEEKSASEEDNDTQEDDEYSIIEEPSKIELVIDEAPDEEPDDDVESDHERVPSGRSTNMIPVSHRERVTDKFRPSVKPNQHFNKEAAAAKLYKALKSFDTDEEIIIQILSTHSAKQRNKIEKTYKYNHRRVSEKSNKNGISMGG